jgi:hypothetical protein
MADRNAKSVPFSAAKAGLSGVVDDAIHRHIPVKIERHRGRESVVLVSADDLAAALQPGYAQALAAEMIVEDGRYTAVLEALGLHGIGASADAAVDDLLEALREYVDRYFANLEFYQRTPNRADHYLPLLLFQACDMARQRQLVEGDLGEAVAVA